MSALLNPHLKGERFKRVNFLRLVAFLVTSLNWYIKPEFWRILYYYVKHHFTVAKNTPILNQ